MNVLCPNNKKKVFLTLLQVFSLVIAMFPFTKAVAIEENKTSKNNLSLATNEQKIKDANALRTESLPKNLQVTSVSVSSNSRTGKVLVAWADGGAKFSQSFNIYRQSGGRYTLLNPAPIAGAAFNFQPRVNEPVGGHFAWWDEAKFTGGQPVYWIEYVGIDGQSSWHGPFAIESKIGNVEITRSRLTTELVQVDSPSQQDVVPASSFTAERVNLKDGSAIQESTSSQSMQWQLAAGAAAKVIVEQNGIARVPRSALEAAGVSFTNPNTIKVFDSGEEIAVTLTSGGTLELYGQNLDTPTTNKRVYWVANINDSVNGKRIQQINAGAFDNGVQASFFTSTIERKDRILRSPPLLNGETDNFFGSLISSNSAVGTPATLQSLLVYGLNQGASEMATLTIAIQGSQLNQAHNITVKLNGTDIGSINGFNDRENVVKQFQVAHSLLRDGKNVVSLTNVPNPDSSMVDYIRLSYSRQYKALSNRIRFSTQNAQAVRVDGFTSSQIKVLDITDPANVKEMLVAPQSNGDGTFSFTLPAGAARSFLAEGAGASLYQPSTVANETSTLNAATNNANFVIISHSKFKQLLAPLVTLRQGQGLTPKIVDVEDVFDEFDYSKHGPAAIKNFLNHARQTWQTPPQYVLLMGDATYDPKDYIASGGFAADLVPTKLVDSLFSETASDDWFGDSNDDGVPELGIGRIAARTEAEANLILSKIISYDNQPAGFTIQNGAVMISDSFDGSYDFEAFTADVRTSLPAQLNVTLINRSQSDTATVRGLIATNINSGKGIVNFMGHGTLSAWTSASIYTANDALAATNAPKYSLFIALTCLNGLFIEPSVNSLAENTHKAPNGGSVAVWASSGLTFPFGQVSISKSFYTQFLGATPVRIGDAIKQSKSATTDMDVRRLTVFFGDPTMRLR